MKKSKTAINETSDYSLFRYSPDQRDVQYSHVKDIMDSMNQWGFLASKPIQAYRHGKQFVIVDGHHRFVAAKNLQIPVLFVLESQLHADSIGDVNGVQRKWLLINFVQMYAKRGLPDYKELAEYNKLGIPLAAAASFLSGNNTVRSGGNSTGITKSICKGTFKVKTRKKIEILASFLRENGHQNSAYLSRSFIASFSLLIRIADFDFDKLAAKLVANPRTLQKTATTDQMIDQIEEIYNYRQSIRIPLAFMAKSAKKGGKR